MENLTLADFQQWANDPMTLKIRDYLIKQRSIFNSLDDSAMIEKTVYSDELSPLEALGLESAMRMSVIQGIDMITDFDHLAAALFDEGVSNV